jgi:hypothetical protein
MKIIKAISPIIAKYMLFMRTACEKSARAIHKPIANRIMGISLSERIFRDEINAAKLINIRIMELFTPYTKKSTIPTNIIKKEIMMPILLSLFILTFELCIFSNLILTLCILL